MSSTRAFATKLPVELIARLTEASKKYGIQKNFIVESALSEKLEDLFDAFDLREAIHQSTGFHPWERVKKERRLR